MAGPDQRPNFTVQNGMTPTLLPNGLRDMLPPEAAHEAALAAKLIEVIDGYGYERVKPPLVEFEEGMTGLQGTVSRRIFRLMDPVSQKMMGVRADMTLQVARIATSRLAHLPRPVRLSYAGDVLRVIGSMLSPERQFTQVGAELVGSQEATADAEMIVLAADALTQIGIGPTGPKRLSVDLMVPPLVPLVCQAMGLADQAQAQVREALDHKDAAAMTRAAGDVGDILTRLMRATGPVEEGLASLQDLELPTEAKAVLDRLSTVVDLIKAALPDVTVTIDPVENRGFEYHTGISFSLFARTVRGELGRGGRYVARKWNADKTSEDAFEPACGVTLYMDTVLRALPGAQPAPRLFAPFGTPPAELARWRTEGWIVVAGLSAPETDETAAQSYRCTHILEKGSAKPLTEEKR